MDRPSAVESPAPSPSAVPAGVLGVESMVGACLQESGNPRLCITDLDARVVTEVPDVDVDSATGVQISPDRRRVAMIREGRLAIYDLEAERVEEHDHQAVIVRWLSEDSVVYRAGDDGMLRTYDLANGAQTDVSLASLLPPGAELYERFDVTTQAGLAALPYSVDDTNQVALVDSSIWEIVEVIDVPGGPIDDIAISADGTQLAVSVVHVLYLWSGDDGSIRRFSPLDATVTSPSFSPTGHALVYIDARGGLMRIGVTERSPVAIVDRSGRDPIGLPVFPDWSS